MIDHVFTDAIGALRDGFEDARLERLAVEESLQSDLLLGDLTWETSYGLPGEGQPPRMRADVTFSWSTWSQSAYRSWFVEGDYTEPPSIEMQIVFRIQNLMRLPSSASVLELLPSASPAVGRETLDRTCSMATSVYGSDLTAAADYFFEVTYEGLYYLDEARLADGGKLDKHFNTLGGWIASMLVRLGDLTLTYRPTRKP